MKKSKKILALLLAIVMIVTVVPLTVFAYETSGDFDYEVLEDGTAEITHYTGYAANLEIPSKLGGYTVTSIGYGAFYGCDSLTEVTIPNSVTEIGGTSGCYNVFRGCVSLREINVADGNSVFSSIDGVLFHKYPSYDYKGEYKGEGMGIDCYPAGKKGKSYQIPDGVTGVFGSAFEDCSSLETIVIPNGVDVFGNFAFSGCSSLKNIKIPDSVTGIGTGAFIDCVSLETITIPKSVEYIDYMHFSPFQGCTSLKEINVVPGGSGEYKSVDGVLFHEYISWVDGEHINRLLCYPAGKTDKSYQVPDGVNELIRYAFSACTSLETVTLPDSVTQVGDLAFLDCTSLKNVNISDSVTWIGYEAFANCMLLSVYIPKSVTHIGGSAFGFLIYSGDDDNPGAFSPITDFKIYGEKGTVAEEYAKDNGFRFVNGKPGETIPGDISGDGDASADDAVMIQRYVAGLEELSEDQIEIADLNSDGIVDEGDAIAILRIDANLAS